MSSSHSSHVVIVGVGPTGTSIFIKFIDEAVNHHLKDISITLIEKNEEIGPGLPFNTNQPKAVLMNTAVSGLNITLGHEHSFFEWLKKKELENDSDVKELGIDHTDPNKIVHQFVPRKLYGRYLQDMLHEAINKARKNRITVHVLNNTHIKEIDQKDDTWVLQIENLAENRKVVGDNLILATGNMSSESYRYLIGKPNYFSSPWEDLSKVDKDKTVVILGSGLSAIDTAKILVAQGHKGLIIFVSGSGALPTVKSIPHTVKIEFEFLTSENLDKKGLALTEVINLFSRELEKIIGKKVNFEEIMNAKQNSETWLDKQIKLAENNVVNTWQIFLDVMYYHVLPYVSKSLSEADLDSFKQKYYGPYMKWAGGMPTVNAKQMLELIRNGQLELVSGLSSVEHEEGKGFRINLNNSEIINAEYAINATGMGHIINDNPLLAQMLAKNYIASPKFGGVMIDPSTYQVKDPRKNLAPYINLHCAGSPIYGNNLAVYAVESSAMAADQIAPALRKKLMKRKTAF